MELNDNLQKKLSKFMTLILRHRPETVGAELDQEGWCDLQIFLQKIQNSGPRWSKLTEGNIREVVANCNKQRFTILEGRIRANQGHSNKNIKMTFREVEPQQNLYHGTSRAAWEKIQQSGLVPMKRHHVHISGSIDTAYKVGRRNDKSPVILQISTKEAMTEGIKFYISDNDVYLCESIPAKFLSVVDKQLYHKEE